METREYSITELAFQDYRRLLERAPRRCRDMLECLIADPPALAVFDQARSLDQDDPRGPSVDAETPLEDELVDRVIEVGLAGLGDDEVRRIIRQPEALLNLQMAVFERATSGSYWSWAIADRPYPLAVEYPTPERVGVNRVARATVPPEPFDLRRKLVTGEQIGDYVDYHADELVRAYAEKQLFIVAVATGGCFFATDLSREVARQGLPHRYESILVHSYHGTESRELTMDTDQFDRIDFANSDVLLTDDIWDTGQTMARLVREIRRRGPRSVRVSTLLRKRHGRVHPQAVSGRGPDFVGFTVPDVFVVGYGLDYDGHHRHLRDIWVYPGEEQAGGEAATTGLPTVVDDPVPRPGLSAADRPARSSSEGLPWRRPAPASVAPRMVPRRRSWAADGPAIGPFAGGLAASSEAGVFGLAVLN
jgi:hypoxanthine phosphoribosyltransferase